MRMTGDVSAIALVIVAMAACQNSQNSTDPTTSTDDGIRVAIVQDSIEFMAPGSARVAVAIHDSAMKPVLVEDSVAGFLQTTGPFSAQWEASNAKVHRNVVISASAPGTGSLVVGASKHRDTIVLRGAAVAFKHVTVAEGFACGIAQDDRVWCWGDNRLGQLGVSTPGICVGAACQYGGGQRAPSPMPVTTPRTFRQVAAGSFSCGTGFGIGYACGHTCAITAAGEVSCWGEGYSASTIIPLPSKATSVIVTPSTSAAFNASNCALMDDGRSICFGATPGQLTQVGGNHAYTVLDVGRYHACGVRSDGDMYCWGSNARGNLGTGSADANAHPDPEKVIAPEKFSSVEVGDYSTCGLALSGKVYCWGLGYSSTGASPPPACPGVGALCQTTPRMLEGGTIYIQFSRSQTSNRLCGLTAPGVVDCWTTYNSAPTTIATPSLRSISVGGPDFNAYFPANGCGVSTADAIWCWNATSVWKIGA